MMGYRLHNSTIAMKPHNRLVAAVVYDGLCNFEFSCVAEVFGLPRPEFGPDWYRFETVAAEPGPLRGLFGIHVQTDASLERLADAGTVIIPGWRDVQVPVPPSLVQALRHAHGRGARLLSVCTGSFVIAATGLLDGKRATTHWQYADILRRLYPKVRVDPDVLYIDEGDIITSAGSAAGLDASLHLVRRDYGSDIANQLARRLVVQPHRDGGQAQFIERPVPKRNNDRLSSVIEAMARDLHREASISELARQAAMSERTFIRRFKQQTGATPADWLALTRVERARMLLETTGLEVDKIAAQCGFGNATNLRHHFRRKLGVSPTTYRARFNNQAA